MSTTDGASVWLRVWYIFSILVVGLSTWCLVPYKPASSSELCKFGFSTSSCIFFRIHLNCSPSNRQLKKYKFFLPVDYLLAVLQVNSSRCKFTVSHFSFGATAVNSQFRIFSAIYWGFAMCLVQPWFEYLIVDFIWRLRQICNTRSAHQDFFVCHGRSKVKNCII